MLRMSHPAHCGNCRPANNKTEDSYASASCSSKLSSGPLITEAPVGRLGQPPSRTQKKPAQRRAVYQRLKDGPAGQTGRELRRVLTEFQKPLPGPRTQFLNDELAPVSPINPRIVHQHHRQPMHGQFSWRHTDLLQTSRTVPQGSVASDMGGTVALAVNNRIMETRIRSDVGKHTDVNVDSCNPEAGTNDATGSVAFSASPALTVINSMRT